MIALIQTLSAPSHKPSAAGPSRSRWWKPRQKAGGHNHSQDYIFIKKEPLRLFFFAMILSMVMCLFKSIQKLRKILAAGRANSGYWVAIFCRIYI